MILRHLVYVCACACHACILWVSVLSCAWHVSCQSFSFFVFTNAFILLLQIGPNNGLFCNCIWYSSHWPYFAALAISINIGEGACQSDDLKEQIWWLVKSGIFFLNGELGYCFPCFETQRHNFVCIQSLFICFTLMKSHFLFTGMKILSEAG